MTIVTRALSYLGHFRLRSLADELAIEKLTAERDEFEAKFKKAITDLAAVTRDYGTRGDLLADARREANGLRPDALAHRARLKRDREQKAAKRAASQ